MHGQQCIKTREKVFRIGFQICSEICFYTVSKKSKSDFLSIVIVITMQTITIESNTKLHAIKVMFIATKCLKVDKSRDSIYLFPLFVF